MESKKPIIETSKSERERLQIKTELKKIIKTNRKKLAKKYEKNKKSNKNAIDDLLSKEIIDCLLKLKKLESAPKRFKDLSKHMKSQKNLNIALEDLKTIYTALELAESHQKQADEIFRLQSKIVFPMVKGFAVENKDGREKGVRAFAKESGFIRKRPGKQSKWTPEKEKKLKERWYTLDGMIDKNLDEKLIREQKIETLKILKNEFPFESQDAVVQKLRKLDVKEIPDVKYHPMK